MTHHVEWVQQIDAELDGELTLPERAALARHLATCAACAGSRASQIELRVALARSAGQPEARDIPRPQVRRRSVALWVAISLLLGATAGWVAHIQWGGPGPRSLEGSRAEFTLE